MNQQTANRPGRTSGAPENHAPTTRILLHTAYRWLRTTCIRAVKACFQPHVCSLPMVALLLASPMLQAQAPTVDGRFFGGGDYELYELTALSIGGSGLYTTIVDDVLYVALVVDRSVNDNVFDDVGGQGSNPSPYQGSADWGRHRTLRVTIDSEFAEFTLRFGDQSWNWYQGYAGQPGTAAPSVDLLTANWISDETVAGGQGTPPPTYVSASSLAWNINEYINAGGADGAGWNMGPESGQNASTDWVSPKLASDPDTVQFQDSGFPATGQPTYVQTEGFIEWEWSMVYEWSVDLAALADEFSDGVIPDNVQVVPGSSHHSPAKGGPDDDIYLNTYAECPEGDNRNPVQLRVEVPDTGGAIAVDQVGYYYQQVGVDTTFQLADGYTGGTYTDNPVTTSVAIDGLDNFILDWDTRNFDLDQGSIFQIQIVAQSSAFDDGEVQQTVAQLDFDLEDCQTSSVPVTLAWFESERQGNTVSIDWATSSETANLGFKIHGQMASGQWRQLNDELIDSHVIDSMEPQFYSASFSLPGIQRLKLEDVSIYGETERHGPFEVGSTIGMPPMVEPVNWDSIGEEDRQHQANRTARWRHRNYDPVRLLVDTDGIHRVSYEDLLDAGLDLDGVPVNHIGMTNQGEPIPIHTEARGRFGQGDFIEFYGEGLDTLYTDSNVYILHVDNHTSRRMPSDNRRPHPNASYHQTYQERIERGERNWYTATSPAESPWYDQRLQVRNRPLHWDFEIDTEDLIKGDHARLEVDLWGMTRMLDDAPDHHVQISFNDTELTQKHFDGQETVNFRLDLPADLAQEGTNTLRLHFPADTGAPVAITSLVGYALEYSRQLRARQGRLSFEGNSEAFAVSGLSSDQAIVYRINNGEVERINRLEFEESDGGEFTVRFRGENQAARYAIAEPDNLLTPAIEPGRAATDITSGQADYLIIAHPNFIEGLDPLIHMHTALGREVKVVDVFDVYDQFSHGIFDPTAIRDFIRATAESMGYQYVLLVGGDTYDYRDDLGLGSRSFIPSLYTSTTRGRVSFAPSDALLVDLDGNGVPDLPIGRFPVRNRAELDEIVNKTLEYAAREYTRQAVVAADHTEPGISFTEASEQYLESFAGWDVQRAYLDELSIAAARNIIFDGIDAGASMTTWWGHSSASIWSLSWAFDSNDVADLENLGRPTAVLQWGCWNNQHVVPQYNTLGHRFLLTEGRGAAVVVGSSTLTDSASGHQLGRRLMPRVATPGMSIGQALTEAKQELAATRPDMTDAILGWTILGDPALVIYQE